MTAGAVDAARSTAAQDRKLVWVDDFDGPPGAQPDPAFWTHELGDGTAVDADPHALAGFNAAQHVGGVVAQLP